MLDFIESLSPLASFIATLLAAGSFAIAILSWPRKTLGWQLVYLHGINADSASSATLEIGGRKFKARHVDVVVIELLNTGNRDIEADHYQRPLTFRFGDNAQVLSAEVLYEDPKEIRAALSHTTNTVTLEPVLLNAGDIVGIRMLVANANDFGWDSRIVGVTNIKPLTDTIRMARITIPGMVVSLVAVLGVYLPELLLPELLPPALSGVALGLLAVGTILIVVGTVLAGREQRRWTRRSTLIGQSVRLRVGIRPEKC